MLYASWLFQRVVPPVASFSLGSLGFLTPFDFSNFQNTLAESLDHGVTARLRMRFECTIMRTVGSNDSSETDSDVLEMRPRIKQTVDQASRDSLNHHTSEYWANTLTPPHRGEFVNANWVKMEEALNRGHRASESFAVLNELVVVFLP